MGFLAAAIVLLEEDDVFPDEDDELPDADPLPHDHVGHSPMGMLQSNVYPSEYHGFHAAATTGIHNVEDAITAAAMIADKRRVLFFILIFLSCIMCINDCI